MPQQRVPVELPVPQIQEQTVKVAKAGPQERAQQRMAFHVTVDVPQALFIDRAMDIPVVNRGRHPCSPWARLSRCLHAVQHQVPTVRKVLMTHEAPQVQFVDEVVHISVVAQRQIDAHGLDNPEDCGDSPHRSERAEKVRGTEGGTHQQGGRRPLDHEKNCPYHSEHT